MGHLHMVQMGDMLQMIYHPSGECRTSVSDVAVVCSARTVAMSAIKLAYYVGSFEVRRVVRSAVFVTRIDVLRFL